MIALTQRMFLALTLMAFCVASVQAGPEEDLQQYVDENTQRLVEKLMAERGLYERDPEAFYQNMDDALEGFVDFRRITARVMGRYARQTTPEQRDEFVERFKRSLFDTYAQALVNNSDGFEISVQQATINPRNEDRASVNLLVTTDAGKRYQVVYSMYRQHSDSDWLMENVVLQRVYIGLAFRCRFRQGVGCRRGDIEAVIDNWGEAVASLNLDEEMEQGAEEQ